jgi:outer membrane protein assembly factor BamB
MKMFLLSALLVSAGLTARAVEDWPEFRGPGAQGHADAAKLPLVWDRTNNVTWRTALPGEGWSSPVIGGNRIWMTTATDGGRSFRALCVDRDSGKLLHDVELFTRDAPMAIHDKNSHASPTPVLEAGRVYVNFGTTGTAALDANTGAILWRNTELQLDHMTGPGSSPVLYRNLIVLTCDGTNVQYVAALDKETGRLAWKTPRSGELTVPSDRRKAFCTPLVVSVDGADQLIIPGAFWAYAYEPLTGKEIWKLRTPGYSTTPRPVAGDGLVFIGTGFDVPQLWAVRLGGRGELADTQVAWKNDKKMPLKPSPLRVGNRLYVVSDTSTASCLDPATGQPIWQQRLTGNFSASPLYATGRIYFFSEEGKTTVVAPGDTFQQLAVNELGERIMASPAVSGDALFVRTDQALYRIEVK